MTNTKTNASSQGGYAPFLSEHWRPEHCDPANWDYVPSTYGVEGVTLVGSPHMKLWDDLTSDNMANPGRKGGIDFAEAEKLQKDIVNNGIDSKNGSMIYYDVDTGLKVNAFHREYTSSQLSIPGWMAQGVRFSSPVARIRFCTRSNNRVNFQHNNTSVADVEVAVRKVLACSPPVTKDAIGKEIDFLGWHLSESTRDSIKDKLFSEYVCSGLKLGVRYIPHNQNTMKLLLPKFEYVKGKVDNPPADTVEWYNNIWNNPDEHCLIVYMSHVEGRIGSIMTSNQKAVNDHKPLHILFAVPVPKGKTSLYTKREKCFSTELYSVEERMLNGFGKEMGIGEFHRSKISWNHPDCQHRFVAQDSENERFDELIYIPNREYN